MKKLASTLILALGIGMSSIAYAVDTSTVTTTGETVTIGGQQVLVSTLVVGAVIGGFVILAIATSGDDTTITVATATATGT